MRKKIFILTPLNTMGFNQSREEDPEWLQARIRIMSDYTKKSLDKQTSQDFEWHILTRSITSEFIKSNFKVGKNQKILTPDQSDEIILSAAGSCDKLYLIRLNSDDCYHHDFVNFVHSVDEEDDVEALVFQFGFMWYQKQNKIIERNFPSPPFYAFVYFAAEYIAGKRYDVPGHNHIRKMLRCKTFHERLWLWLINDFNNKILRGSSYPDPDLFASVEPKVLRDFL